MDLKSDLHYQLCKAISLSDFFVVVLSSSTSSSHWVGFERKTAEKILDKSRIYYFDLDNKRIQHESISESKEEVVKFSNVLKQIQPLIF